MPTWGEILKEVQAELPNRPDALDFVRRKYLSALSAYTGRSTILYATRWSQDQQLDPALTSIGPEDVQGFMEVVHGLPSDRGLDLILHSPGGSAEVTEAIVDYLRAKFIDIRVLVPQAAMSAATMLACAADEIVMGKHSSLGPIDPQMIVNVPGSGRIAVPAQSVLDQFELASKAALNGQGAPWYPILQMYGPALIVQCQNAIALASSLVATWLERYMFAGELDAAAKAKSIAEHLADHGKHKTHSRFFSAATAESIGLKVRSFESDQQLQDLVLSVFHAATHTMSATPCVKIIENHLGRGFFKQHLTMPFAQQILQPG